MRQLAPQIASAGASHQFRAELAARLRARGSDIEQALRARVYSIADPVSVGDPQYVDGLKKVMSAAIEYALVGVEEGPSRPGPVPAELQSQARSAARNGVSLDTVLRRYFAGYMLIEDFLISEAFRVVPTPGAELREVIRTQADLLDHLIARISQEYVDESEDRVKDRGRRHAERVRRLLAGDSLDPSALTYELDAWHLAAVATGPGAVEAIRDLAGGFNSRLLFAHPEEATVWAWLGGDHTIAASEAQTLAQAAAPPEVSLALGEPGRGIEGWRLSHYQAKAALLVALRAGPRVVCYTDVALLATALCDEVLAASLRNTYLAPLEAERDGGFTARATLRAFFGAGQNASSAAAALGVSRKTVSARIRGIEEKIGARLGSHGAELQTALKLHDLG